MKKIIAVTAAILIAGCASTDGRKFSSHAASVQYQLGQSVGKGVDDRVTVTFYVEQDGSVINATTSDARLEDKVAVLRNIQSAAPFQSHEELAPIEYTVTIGRY